MAPSGRADRRPASHRTKPIDQRRCPWFLHSVSCPRRGAVAVARRRKVPFPECPHHRRTGEGDRQASRRQAAGAAAPVGTSRSRRALLGTPSARGFAGSSTLGCSRRRFGAPRRATAGDGQSDLCHLSRARIDRDHPQSVRFRTMRCGVLEPLDWMRRGPAERRSATPEFRRRVARPLRRTTQRASGARRKAAPENQVRRDLSLRRT